MSTIIKPARNGMPPVHPGEILREDLLVPLNMSPDALSKALLLPLTSVNDILQERGPVTADIALRLARYLGGDPQSWLNLQQSYDLKVRRASMQGVLEKIEPLQHPILE